MGGGEGEGGVKKGKSWGSRGKGLMEVGESKNLFSGDILGRVGWEMVVEGDGNGLWGRSTLHLSFQGCGVLSLG